MSRSAPSKPRIRRPRFKTLVVILGVVVVLWFPVTWYAHHRADGYAHDAASASPAASVAELRAAHALDPGNHAYRLDLAKAYLRNGQYDQAIATAKKTGGSDGAVVQSQAYLEQGSGGVALAAVQNVMGAEAASQRTLCGAVATAPASEKLELAQELYTKGLYRSAERVVAGAPSSTAKYLLQAHSELEMQPQRTSNVVMAQAAAEQGSALDPASLPAHELLRDIYLKQGSQQKAAAQMQLIKQLEQGSA